jgi:hypothetical protein
MHFMRIMAGRRAEESLSRAPAYMRSRLLAARAMEVFEAYGVSAGLRSALLLLLVTHLEDARDTWRGEPRAARRQLIRRALKDFFAELPSSVFAPDALPGARPRRRDACPPTPPPTPVRGPRPRLQRRNAFAPSPAALPPPVALPPPARSLRGAGPLNAASAAGD